MHENKWEILDSHGKNVKKNLIWADMLWHKIQKSFSDFTSEMILAI